MKQQKKTSTAQESAASKSTSAAKRGAQPKAGRTGAKPAPKAERGSASTRRSQSSRSTTGAKKTGEAAAQGTGANAQSQQAARKNGAKNTVGKIMKTTDGFLGNRPNIKKPRRVAVVEQREDDGAVAIVRIFKKRGKRADDPHAYIQELTLLPQDHTSLTEESIVEAKVILGVNTGQGKKAIFPSDLSEVNDELTDKELSQIHNGVHNDTAQHRQTFLNKLQKWFNHFKQ